MGARRAARPRPLDDVLLFMRLLWELDHELRSASKRMKRTIGLTGPQRLAVRLVGRMGRPSAGQLAEALHVHPSTLTGVLDRLVRAGALTRETDPIDGRRALFALTQRGRRIDRLHAGTVEWCVRRALAKVPSSNLRAARGVLSRVAAELDGWLTAGQ